jgi:hypothetical protein
LGTTTGVRTATLAATIGLLVSAALIAGCSDEPEPPAGDLGGGYVLGAVRQLPASLEGEAPMILVGDLDRASKLAGSERPADADSDQVVPWISDLTASGGDGQSRVFVPLPDVLLPFNATPSDMEAEVGWSVVDVDSFVALTQPPEQMLVVSGDFDEDTLSGDLSEVEDGIVTDIVGEDHEQNVTDPTAFSRVGAPTRFAVDDGRIAASSDTQAIRDWLAGGEALADDDAYAGIAQALDRSEVYAAVIARAPSGIDLSSLDLGEEVSAEQVERLVQQLEEELPEASFDTVGIGWSVDDQGPLVTTAYHFESEDDAVANINALRERYESGTSIQAQRPFSDFLEVEDVQNEGSAVLVTTRPAGDGRVDFAYRALLSRDSLFVSR